jgi:predicted ArsR family transcriptional regulator
MPARSTSVAALHSVRPAASQRKRIFQFILKNGAYGATVDEITVNLGLSNQTACPRRQELEKRGYLVDSGIRRPTRTGRQAIVWVVPPSVIAYAKSKGVL